MTEILQILRFVLEVSKYLALIVLIWLPLIVGVFTFVLFLFWVSRRDSKTVRCDGGGKS